MVMAAAQKNKSEAISYFGSNAIVTGRNMFRAPNQKQFFPFRSGLEVMYAKYLDSVDRKYEYEKHAFQIIDDDGLKIHYIPDFYLPDCETFIEIVSHENHRNTYKAILFREQYPHLELRVYSKNVILEMCS